MGLACIDPATLHDVADPDDAWTELAAALKSLHTDSGLSGVELANRTQWSQSKVSRIENRQTKPTPDDVRTWAKHTGASAELTADLLALAADVATMTRSWRAAHRRGLAAAQREVAALEARSSTVINLDTNVVPGLLQVPGYAERILRMRDASTSHDVAEAVAARMNRQAVLFDPTKDFTFVITEGVALYCPGGPSVRSAQASRLMEMLDQPNITLGILPYALADQWPVVPSDAWMIFYKADGVTALSEAGGGDDWTTDEDRISGFVQRTYRALELALSGDAARDLIRSSSR